MFNNKPSSTWQTFTTFLDQLSQQNQQQPQQPNGPGQMTEWEQGYQMGQPTQFLSRQGFQQEPMQPPGMVPSNPTVPGAQTAPPMNFMPNSGSHNTLQNQITSNTNPMAGIMAALGQGERWKQRSQEREQRKQEFSGGFGSGGYKKDSRSLF